MVVSPRPNIAEGWASINAALHKNWIPGGSSASSCSATSSLYARLSPSSLLPYCLLAGLPKVTSPPCRPPRDEFSDLTQQANWLAEQVQRLSVPSLALPQHSTFPAGPSVPCPSIIYASPCCGGSHCCFPCCDCCCGGGNSESQSPPCPPLPSAGTKPTDIPLEHVPVSSPPPPPLRSPPPQTSPIKDTDTTALLHQSSSSSSLANPNPLANTGEETISTHRAPHKRKASIKHRCGRQKQQRDICRCHEMESRTNHTSTTRGIVEEKRRMLSERNHLLEQNAALRKCVVQSQQNSLQDLRDLNRKVTHLVAVKQKLSALQRSENSHLEQLQHTLWKISERVTAPQRALPRCRSHNVS